jgi:alkylmercury lyase-like protein
VSTRPVGLEEFDRGWLEAIKQTPAALVIIALGGLTRLGERPAPLDRLARILNRSPDQTTALVRENTTARIENDLIHWTDPYPGDRTRRTIHIGDREIAMNSGCAPDLFAFAAVLDVPFRVHDTCATTGKPIHIDFVPNGYQRADPPDTVTVLLPVEQVQQVIGRTFEHVNTHVCTHQPFFASAEAAEPTLATHPGSRIFTVEEMFERSWYTYLHHTLRPLIHDSHRTRLW